ncbi:MAG: ribosome maturation factor RimM [Aquificaceae bacterium]
MERERSINEEDQYVVIGKIKDTYGLKGELKVEPYLHPKHWKRIKRVYLRRRGGDYVAFPISFLKPHGKALVLRFKGFDHIEQVDGFRGAKVFLPREELPKRKKDEYYYFELEGLEVFTKGGKHIGRITGVCEQKPYDLLEIDGGRLYIPFVEALVKKVMLKEGKVIVEEMLSEL